MARFNFPWPPSVNKYYRRHGHIMHVSSKGTKYHKDIRAIIGDTFPTLTGRLAVEIHAYPPDRRKRDIDNLFKALLDSMQKAGVYADDNQIDLLTISRHHRIDDGMVVVNVEEIKEPTP